jgi:hypothetical protein
MPSEFETVFLELRDLLRKHAGSLQVKDDGPTSYWLETGVHPQLKKRMCAAGVEIRKGYVSYHLMAVYVSPELLDSVSRKLKARMQGKSCFNFKVSDPVLFAELEQLTLRGFAGFSRSLGDVLQRLKAAKSTR